MESIPLTEEHKARIREMCRALFPEYSTCQIKIEADNIVDIREVTKEKGFAIRARIHWFEFSIASMSKRLFEKVVQQDKHMMPEYVDLKLGYLLRDTILIGIHLIDYLYSEFKLIK